MMRSTSYECDACETRCHPDSLNAKDWLYSNGKEHLCFDCMLEAAGMEVVTE